MEYSFIQEVSAKRKAQRIVLGAEDVAKDNIDQASFSLHVSGKKNSPLCSVHSTEPGFCPLLCLVPWREQPHPTWLHLPTMGTDIQVRTQPELQNGSELPSSPHPKHSSHQGPVLGTWRGGTPQQTPGQPPSADAQASEVFPAYYLLSPVV